MLFGTLLPIHLALPSQYIHKWKQVKASGEAKSADSRIASETKGASPNYFFQNNVIVTLSWNPLPPSPHNVTLVR